MDQGLDFIAANKRPFTIHPAIEQIDIMSVALLILSPGPEHPFPVLSLATSSSLTLTGRHRCASLSVLVILSFFLYLEGHFHHSFYIESVVYIATSSSLD